MEGIFISRVIKEEEKIYQADFISEELLESEPSEPTPTRINHYQRCFQF